MAKEEDLFLFERVERVIPDRSAARASGDGVVVTLLQRIADLLLGLQLGMRDVHTAVNGTREEAGGAASQTIAMTSGNSALKLRCETTFARAQAFTVKADIDTPGVQAQMTVQWRVKGVTIQRTIDVAAGASIGGVAESVSVTIADVTTQGPYATTPTVYNASVVISPGERPSSPVPPVQTGALVTLNPGAASVFQVPSGANSVYVNGESGGQPAVLYVDHYTAGTVGTTAVKINTTVVNALQSAPIPLIAGTAQIEVTNQGAGEAAVTVVWGIDG